MTYYRTKDVPNSQLALYQLSIRSPGEAYADYNSFTFPLSPSSLRTEPTALSNFSNTQGTPAQLGVARIVDTFGLTPPVFTIEGTTGWDYHSTDGFVLTGLQSIRLLQNFIKEYVSLNQTLIQAGNPKLYALEFYDYFMAQFWQVDPIGPVIIRQINDRPLLSFYRFQMAGIKPVRESPYSDATALAQLLSTPTTSVIADMTAAVSALTTAYAVSGVLQSGVTAT